MNAQSEILYRCDRCKREAATGIVFHAITMQWHIALCLTCDEIFLSQLERFVRGGVGAVLGQGEE